MKAQGAAWSCLPARGRHCHLMLPRHSKYQRGRGDNTQPTLPSFSQHTPLFPNIHPAIHPQWITARIRDLRARSAAGLWQTAEDRELQGLLLLSSAHAVIKTP